MLAESALCLAFDTNPPTSGQVTTAVGDGGQPARPPPEGRDRLRGRRLTGPGRDGSLERLARHAGTRALARGRGRPAARLQPGRPPPVRRVRLAGRRGSSRARPAGGAVDHLPDDARVLARPPAGPARRRGTGRPRAERPGRTLPRPHPQRLVRRGRRRRPDLSREERLPARVRGARRRQRDLRRPAWRDRAAGRGPRRAAHPLLGRGARHGRRGVGRVVHHPGLLPRRQRQHAHRGGAARRGGRHRGPQPARQGAADRHPGGPRPGAQPRLAAAGALRRAVEARCWTTTSTPPPTRSARTARRSATGWSGPGLRCTCGRRSAPPPRTGCSTTRSALFDASVREGWAVDGADGFVYTVDWEGAPVVRERMHWVAAEATATAAALHAATGDPSYATWYATWWDHVAEVFLDPELGSWRHELDAQNRPSGAVWNGKPDTYHAYQATLIPRLPLTPTLARRCGTGCSTSSGPGRADQSVPSRVEFVVNVGVIAPPLRWARWCGRGAPGATGRRTASASLHPGPHPVRALRRHRRQHPRGPRRRRVHASSPSAVVRPLRPTGGRIWPKWPAWGACRWNDDGGAVLTARRVGLPVPVPDR